MENFIFCAVESIVIQTNFILINFYKTIDILGVKRRKILQKYGQYNISYINFLNCFFGKASAFNNSIHLVLLHL